MSTPTPDIAIGDIWATVNDLGIGLGEIAAGSQVRISDYLEPYSPGVAQTEEWTVVSTYSYVDWGYDDFGNLVEMPTSRRLAYPEPDFRILFEPYGGA